jgi:hypothetical protein
MPYSPPAGNVTNFPFTGGYSPPAGNAANFAFTVITASASPTIGDLALDATGRHLTTASLDATIGEITADATGTVISTVKRRGGDVAVPWWWAEYVRNRLAERAAAREKIARTGSASAVVPMPWATGEIEHLPNTAADDQEAIMLALVLLDDAPTGKIIGRIFRPRNRLRPTLQFMTMMTRRSPSHCYWPHSHG